jgi:hypothetical protein
MSVNFISHIKWRTYAKMFQKQGAEEEKMFGPKKDED